MKYLAVVFISCFLLIPVFNQTATQKTTGTTKKAVKKPTPKPSTTSKRAGDSSAKSTKSTSKPKAAGTTKGAVAKTGKNSKNLSTKTVDPTAQQRPGSVAKKIGSSTKTGAAKPNSDAPIQPEIPEGQAEYDAAIAIADLTERVAALRKFLVRFSLSTLQTNARDAIVNAMVEIGNAAIRNGDTPGAAAVFVQASKDAPVPISDQLFTTVLAKLPVNLFFRGEKDSATIIARVLEGKSVSNSGQLISLAEFYVTIENGTEAKRLAKAAIDATPTSSAAYQMLGLASRVNFQLDESAAAYARAVEIDPESGSALRGLAEMKRALGKPDEAVELYRKILAKDEASVPGKTGLILALFENGKRDEAETAMADALTTNPGNVMLLAGAAYWYAAHNEAQKAVDTAQRAIAVDPRFIWSHIALARGYMAQQLPLSAEKTLLAARRYGNFPTIDYEIASARAMAGLYREAAEELSKSYSVDNGVVSTRLGGQVLRKSTDFIELVSLERRASIAAPQSADTQENARQLAALLDLWTKLNAQKADSDALGKAADDFVRGDDRMKAHRQLFAAQELLDRKKELPKVIELAKAAVANADAAVDVPSPTAAVMAEELYESRRLAMLKDEYISIPDVPRSTLLSIIRGRIEDISGWALYQTDNSAESIMRLRRAVSVFPPDSAWWRSTTWRLGSVFESLGQDAEALNSYFKSYKSGQPDAFKYSTIAAVYKRINGSTFGLDAKIGPNPAGPPPDVSARKAEPVVIPNVLPAATSPSPERTSENRLADSKLETPPDVVTKSANDGSRSDAAPLPSPTAAKVEPTPEPTPEPKPVSVKTEPTPESTPVAEKMDPKPESTPETVKTDPPPSPTLAAPTETSQGAESKQVVLDAPSKVTNAGTLGPAKDEKTTLKTESTSEPTPTPAAELAAKIEHEKTPEALVPQPSPGPTKTLESALRSTETTTPGKILDPTVLPFSDTVAKVFDPTTEASNNKPEEKKTAKTANPLPTTKELFPPVIITIPAKDVTIKPQKNGDSSGAITANTIENTKTKPDVPEETKIGETPATSSSQSAPARPRIVPSTIPAAQCSLILSEESLSLKNSSGELAVIVRTEDDRDISALVATSHSPKDVYVRLEPIAGISGRELFVVRSINRRPGVYTVTFALPCGKKDLVVKVH